jgi:hypothetical protein
MPNDMQRMLLEDLDRRPAPPMGDLVDNAVARGRRLRRARTARGLGAGAAALVVLAVLVAVGVTRVWGPTTNAVGTSPAVVAGAQPTAKRVPATSAGVLELLTRLMPPGTTSGYAVASDDPLHVQLMIDRGQGKAMVRVSIFHASSGCSSNCRPAGGGAVAAVGEIPDNCIQRWRVTVYHANGDAIAFDLSSCLEWNGTANPPSPRALSDAEAIAIGANAGFGTTMPADLVAAGAQHFGNIRPIDGG